MDFVHTSYQPGETIAALATPPGEGGISIIRISGEQAIQVADRLFSGPVDSYSSHTAHLGYIRNKQGEILDQALLLVMRAPRSYTGEETVELHCHGGRIASQRVLEAVFVAGARPAKPGEFTLKAFLNGKIDLAQAEGVQRVIGAKNTEAFAAAQNQLDGRLSKKILSFQKELTQLAALFEAWVDFPDEGLAFATEEEVIQRLKAIEAEMLTLVDTFEEGKRLDQGISLCLAGPPNAGKSSLLNSLLDEQRAIVTSLPGTTRDLLHEEMLLNGLHFRLTDTAGIRSTEEAIEKEGIRRAKEAVQKADIILLVVDVTAPPQDPFFSALPPEKTLLVWNKIDLPHSPVPHFPYSMTVQISAKEGRGMETLKETLDRLIWKNGPPPKDQILLTSLRHKQALQKALESLKNVLSGLQGGISPEFLTADLRDSLRYIGQIIGTNISEDILDSIFSQFCIGK
ncbi:MAG: tRNA modification GTPase MnmE [Chlamydiae bacterium]|nr:tRNA modification GTPase MnmE [Chlamydiota bacterium]